MNARTSWKVIIPDCLLFIFIIGLFTIWKKIFIILTTKLEINDNTVSGKIGLIHTQTLDSPIKQITSIKIDQSFMGKIFNYGNVYINTPAGNFEFQCMAEPNKIKDYILNRMK